MKMYEDFLLGNFKIEKKTEKSFQTQQAEAVKKKFDKKKFDSFDSASI